MQQESKQEVSGLYSNKFLFNVEDSGVSSLSPGYIIRPDGITVKVENHEDHDDVFSRYINSYINNDEETKYFVGKAITMLTNEYGHIIYYGIKTSDAMDIYTNQGNTNGYAFFFIPDDINSITEEQVNVINEIMSSNYSTISQQEILPIKYQSIHSPEVEPIDNLINQLMNTKKRIK